ncbi:hypothetical protein [Klebsiella aerogenes]|uniref:hypothetical protein n=1 Tax=Klebsiella aerogenes TaxID=548 RepID=UPI0018C8C2C7|nr:hypothetical protein [Klebsiella aerogenes]
MTEPVLIPGNHHAVDKWRRDANQSEDAHAITHWAYSWNAPRKAIASPIPTYEELQRRDRENAALACAQDLLQKQSVIVRMSVNTTASKLEKEQGIKRANAYLAKTFLERILPRINIVSERYHIGKMTADTVRLMYRFNHLPDMSKEDIDLLAQDVSTFITMELSSINDEMPDAGALKLLHALYVRAAAITHAFRQSAPDFLVLTHKPYSQLDRPCNWPYSCPDMNNDEIHHIWLIFAVVPCQSARIKKNGNQRDSNVNNVINPQPQ